MKTRLHLPLLASLAFTCSASAQDIIKANNSLALNLPASWTGSVVPGPDHTAVWNSSSSPSAVNLGANLAWQGIHIDNPGKDIAINGTQTLTLGSSGITVNNRSLTLAPAVVFSADSEMRFFTTAAIGITFNGPTNLGGHSLAIFGNRDSHFISGSGVLSNGSLVFAHGSSNNGQCQFNAVTSGNFSLFGTGRNTQIIVNSTAVSNPQLDVDLDDTSMLRLGNIFDNNALQIGNLSGVAGTVVSPNYLVSTGIPIVVRTLAVNQSSDATFAGLLAGSNNNRSLGFTKDGPATLALTNPNNEYSGPTTIHAGTLHFAGDGRLNFRPIPNQDPILGTSPTAITNNATLHIDSTATQELTGPMTGTGTWLKSNIGFLTYSGDGSGFSGDTHVDGGRLILNGTLGGDVAVAANAALGGTGNSTRHLTTAAGSSLIQTGGTTTAGLTFNGTTISNPTYIEFASPQNDATTYEVLGYGAGGLSGYENLVPLARGTLEHDTANQKVLFHAITPGIRIWNIADGVWNSLGVLQNWAGGDQVFIQGDHAIFNAIGADTTITLDGLLAPSTVTVEHPANTCTFTGSGGFAGSGTFTKSGTGIVRIGVSSPNFSGPTVINDGIFRFIDGGFWGTSTITNDASLEADVAGQISLINGIDGSGTLTKRGSGTLTLGGITQSNFTGTVLVENGRLVLDKKSALGISLRGAKTVTITPGGQIDLNNYSQPPRKEVKRPDLTYTFQIAGDGDGRGAIVNNSYSLRWLTKDLDFSGFLNLVLSADASIGGTGGYDIGFTQDVHGTITGNGHTLTKRGSNTIHLRAPASNIALVVREGILGIENDDNAFGGAAGSVTVHPNASVGGSGPLTIATPVTLHGGASLQAMPNWYTSFNLREESLWTGPITLLGNATLLADPWGILIEARFPVPVASSKTD